MPTSEYKWPTGQEQHGTPPEYMERMKNPEPLTGTAPVRKFNLSVTPDGVTGSIVLREGTAGRTFTVSSDGKQLLVDGAPAVSVVLTHDDTTGQIEVVR